jgi:hypothetical protein
MNVWSDPQYLFWQVLSLVGGLPMTIVEIAIGVWALRVTRERPRTARLMMGFVALLVFYQFGIARVCELLYAAGSSFGGMNLSAGLGLYLGYSLELATTVAIWWMAILAVFGHEEHELEIVPHDGERPGERP